MAEEGVDFGCVRGPGGREVDGFDLGKLFWVEGAVDCCCGLGWTGGGGGG